MGQDDLPNRTHKHKRIKQNFVVFNWSISDNMLSKFSEVEPASPGPNKMKTFGQKTIFSAFHQL